MAGVLGGLVWLAAGTLPMPGGLLDPAAWRQLLADVGSGAKEQRLLVGCCLLGGLTVTLAAVVRVYLVRRSSDSWRAALTYALVGAPVFTLSVILLGLQDAATPGSVVGLADLHSPDPQFASILLKTLAVGAVSVLAVAFVRAYLVAQPASALTPASPAAAPATAAARPAT